MQMYISILLSYSSNIVQQFYYKNLLLLLKTHFYDVRNDNFLSQETVTKKSKIKNAEDGIISLAPPTTFKSVNKASKTIGALFLVVIVATKHTTSSRMPMYQINLHINDSNTFLLS